MKVKKGTLPISTPKMATGGEVNPYLEDYRSAREGEMAALAELPQQGSDEYEKLRKERYQKTGQWGNTGQRRYQMYQGDLMKASGARKAAEKKAAARSEQGMGIGGQSGMSMFGALKARGDQKQAMRTIATEKSERVDAEKAKQRAEYDTKVDAWKEENPRGSSAMYSVNNPYRYDSSKALLGTYAGGGMVGGSSLFSLLKKPGR